MQTRAATITWTERDREILKTITGAARLITLAQAARTWWGQAADPERSARRRLTDLSGAGYLDRRVVNAHPELRLERPVVTWRVGEAPPEAGSVAYELKTRWVATPVPTTIYSSTKKTANRFGGRAGIPRLLQTDHDLHVTALYLRLVATDPERSSHWVGEDQFTHRSGEREKVPDAMLVDPASGSGGGGGPYLVVEFGGSYDAVRVAKFHHHCEARGLAYELW